MLKTNQYVSVAGRIITKDDATDQYKIQIEHLKEAIATYPSDPSNSEKKVRIKELEDKIKGTKDAWKRIPICVNYRKDTGACRSGCGKISLSAGAICPYEYEGDEADKFQDDCPCYKR